MPRVKRGTIHVKKRRRLRKAVKGYKWSRKKTIRLAKTATVKAGAYARRDRRTKKRASRKLWQIRLNAAVREHGLTYSHFIHLLKQNKIELDRKVLAQIALEQPKIFAKIVDLIKNEK